MLKQEILKKIERKRAKLIEAVSAHGLSSKDSLKYSQELDELLNEYNNLIRKP